MKLFLVTLFAFIAISCSPKQEKLPFLGNSIVGATDTIYPKIADFSFIDQDSTVVTNTTFENKIYVADFIFLSCTTICPKMNRELNKVYKEYKDNAKVCFLSHTIDPENDTVLNLKAFTQAMEIDKNWHFVTGSKDSIYSLATKSYFTTAYPDDKEPGGLVHGGGLMLVDKNRHIRGVYDGTNPEETKRLITDIKLLLND